MPRTAPRPDGTAPHEAPDFLAPLLRVLEDDAREDAFNALCEADLADLLDYEESRRAFGRFVRGLALLGALALALYLL